VPYLVRTGQYGRKCVPCEGLLSEFSVSGDQRVGDITVQHLLQHSSGWDQRVIGDPLFMPGLRSSSHPDARRRALASKSNIIKYMLNHTLHYKPGKPRCLLAT